MASRKVSIHTLHELEARNPIDGIDDKNHVSIHTLHELEASFFFPCDQRPNKVSIHTLHELEARNLSKSGYNSVKLTRCFHSYASRIGSKLTGRIDRRYENYKTFPFIRFTNWKQDILLALDYINTDKEFPFIRFTNWKQVVESTDLRMPGGSFHSYASRIGSKILDETNPQIIAKVSIHTLHELEASLMSPWL